MIRTCDTPLKPLRGRGRPPGFWLGPRDLGLRGRCIGSDSGGVCDTMELYGPRDLARRWAAILQKGADNPITRKQHAIYRPMVLSIISETLSVL